MPPQTRRTKARAIGRSSKAQEAAEPGRPEAQRQAQERLLALAPGVLPARAAPRRRHRRHRLRRRPRRAAARADPGADLVHLRCGRRGQLRRRQRHRRACTATRTGRTSRSTKCRQVMIDAVLAAEDRDFFNHAAIDPVGTARALWANLRNEGSTQGGSTITQQYVKTVYLSSERTLSAQAQRGGPVDQGRAGVHEAGDPRALPQRRVLRSRRVRRRRRGPHVLRSRPRRRSRCPRPPTSPGSSAHPALQTAPTRAR